MNRIELVGNLTRDPELRQTSGGIPVAHFTVAVNRRFRGADGQQQTDFIRCVAWRQTAEFVSRYFARGSRIGIVGSIQTNQYQNQQGETRYTTEVLCDEVEFVTSKAQNPGSGGGSGYRPSEPPPDDRYGARGPDRRRDDDYGGGYGQRREEPRRNDGYGGGYSGRNGGGYGSGRDDRYDNGGYSQGRRDSGGYDGYGGRRDEPRWDDFGGPPDEAEF